uniref:Leucine-rich repeat-containing N-terminal plant-type domain-containing protein n=1 Tax=Amphora coffeiformis TaxID=265554 RepID=A0A7S3LAS2_9STRA
MTTREDLMIPGLSPAKSSSTNKSTNPFDDDSLGEEHVQCAPPHSELTDSITGDSEMEPVQYSKRGGLISGHVFDAETQSQKSKDRDDVESGHYPPDSDYASRAPKSIWDAPSIEGHRHLQEKNTPPPTNSPVAWNIPREPGKRRKFLRILVGVTFAVLVLAILAVFLIVRSGKDPESDRQRAIDVIIEKASAPETLKTKDSPQFKARQWLLKTDTLALDPSTGATDAQIIQRYSLATFYYSTGGDTTWSTNNWLEGAECDSFQWDYIDCNDNKEVRALSFDAVGLSGELPPELGHLSSLVNLIIKSDETLSGTIPPSLGHLVKLEQLGISFTGVKGSIPSELFRATNLRYLNLQHNDLEGTMPTDIGLTTSLEKLIVSNNKLSGNVPWTSLPRSFMEVLALGNNQFTGSIGKEIGNIPELKYLYLENNQFNGEIVAEIGSATSLRSINFDHNLFNATIPRQVGRLVNLEYLSMQYNQLTGGIPSEVQHLVNLQTLALGDNKLTGGLPDLVSLTNLHHLYLFGNELTGVIPAYIYDLQSIEILFLSSNNFTGPLFFTSRSRLESRLKGLYLSDNQLQGPIPMALCHFRNLEAIFLDENQFTGGLPPCISDLTELSQFYVFKNQLYGEIPSEYSVLLELEGLGLEDNEFTGNIPEGVCQLADLNSIELWSDCGGDTPEITCDCCTVCCPSADCGQTPARW